MRTLDDIIIEFDDFDEQNFEFAKVIFEIEEGRQPNMNIVEEMNLVATIEIGIRHTRK